MNGRIKMMFIAAFILIAGIFLKSWMLRSSLPQSVLSADSGNISMPVPTLQATPTNQAPYPSQVLNLTNWKVTMPFGSSDKPTSPLEIRQPDLATYKVDPWFTVSSDGRGITFRAPVNGVTTSGSNYPRSELREMTNNGESNASWSSTQGTHSMYIEEAITHLPKNKPQVVAGQIHDDSDDIIVIRLEQANLYVNVNGKNVFTLDSHYSLGKRFNVKFVVSGGKTYVYYNGNPKPSYTLSKKYSSSYFKAGAYTQSNCSKEGNSTLCNADNYGEVTIYKLDITHQ